MPASDLLYFNADNAHAFENSIDTMVLVTRQVSKTLNVFALHSCRALLDEFAMRQGEPPYWLPGDAIVELY